MSSIDENEKQTDEIIDEKEASCFYSDDSFKMYVKEAKSYPLLKKDEERELLIKSAAKDEKARQRLIECNLRLVIKIALEYKEIFLGNKHLKILDIIQEGNLGLIKAIDSFDIKKGNVLSTYAVSCIRGYILDAIRDKEEELKKSRNMKQDIKDYLKFIYEYQKKGLPIPRDAETCEILGFSPQKLKDIKKAIGTTTISMNKTIGNDDDDKIEIVDTIASEENDYDFVLDEMTDFALLIALKEKLKPLEYYIIYNRILSREQKTLEVLAQALGITIEGVRKKEVKTKKKIRKLIQAGILSRTQTEIREREKNNFEKLNPKPITPEEIILFSYVSDNLNEIEISILSLIYFGKYRYTKAELASIFHMPLSDFNKLYLNLKQKINALLKNKEKYTDYKRLMIKTHGTKLFDLIKNFTYEQISYDDLKEKYENMSYEELENMFNGFGNLPPKSKHLLERFTSLVIPSYKSDKEVECEVNTCLKGYKRKNINIETKKLYETYKKNKEHFSDIERMYLECFIFNIRDKSEFTLLYGDHKTTKVHRHRFMLIIKLEKMYYGIDDLLDPSLTKEEYISIINTHKDKIPEDKIKLLNLYYGVNTEKMSIQELVALYKVSKEEMSQMIYQAKDSIQVIITNRSQGIKVNKKSYTEFLTDLRYEIPKSMRIALQLFLILNKDYKYISEYLKSTEHLNTTEHKVAGMVSKGLVKLDFYRFNILDKVKITPSDIEAYLEHSNKENDKTLKDILMLKYGELLQNDEIGKRLGIKLSKINRTINDFNRDYKKFLIENILLDTSEIEKELNRHISESVLTNEEKRIVSMYLGIKSEWNKTGEKFTSKRVNEILRIKIDVARKCRDALDKIKLRKIGVNKPDMIFNLERDEIDRILDDPHVPISVSDKELICICLGLKGKSYKTLKELSKELNENEKTLRRRYQIAIVNINKYLLHEIEGKLSYEYDYLPNLKYFSKIDRQFIKDYFLASLSCEQISEKYKISKEKVKGAIARIQNTIYRIINNKNANLFDFDYYLEAIKDRGFPYNGNLSITIRAFELYTGNTGTERMNLNEIIEKLDLSITSETLKRMLDNFMLAVCKHRDGIRKEMTFTYDEIKEYYMSHKDELTSSELENFLSFFKKYETDRTVSSDSNVSQVISNRLLMETQGNLFKMDECSKEYVINMLRNNGRRFSSSTNRRLMTKFNITERELMTGKELKHVYRILHALEQNSHLSNEPNATLSLQCSAHN